VDLKVYYEWFDKNPFSEQTIEAGELFTKRIAGERKRERTLLIKDLDMVENGNKA